MGRFRVLQKLPLRLRLAMGYGLFLMVTISAVGLFILASMESNLHLEADNSLRLRAASIEREITAEDGTGLDRKVVAATLSDLSPLEEFSSPGIYVQVLDHHGVVLASSPNLPGGWLPLASETIKSTLSGQESSDTVPVEDQRVRLLARPVRSNDGVTGVVLVGESLHLLGVTLRRMQQLLLATAVGAALVSMLGGWWLTGRALGPVAEVSRVARGIAATGRFQQRIAVPPARDELGELVGTFNEMLDRLERTFRRQREFLADASHELRGPLTVIRGNLDLLKLEMAEEDRKECAREATEEAERMSRLVSDLLFLGEADAQDVVEHQPVALHDLLSELWERAQGLDAGAHRVVLARNDPATVLGDRDRLAQMVWNLAENALRYTPSGGQVTLSLHNHGDVAELAVADTGIGIAPEHLPHLFERFYRVDKARSRDHGGAGLGLAIVKQTAEAHGGQVRVRSRTGEGTLFAVALPTYRF
ncbi:MAG: ATP-binding protein [Chloroflexi bacterium]|nr:ATP-binding protein [Chloroflexota bacterium]